jgi:hypothetical protein
MMGSKELQSGLFQQIKSKVGGNSSMAEEIASILDISSDSAYRRIRGEKIITLDETEKLCRHYKISLDHLMNLQTDSFVFNGKFVNPHSFQYDTYLTNIMQIMKQMSAFENKQLIYLAKDIPIFHHFHFRELAAFKYYFWMKNILQVPEFANKKFKISDFPDHYFEVGRATLQYYNQFDSIELWNIESLNSTLRQIEFYHDSNIFLNTEDIYKVYESLERLTDHLELQATEGYKMDAEDPRKKHYAPYQLYFNEILILEGNILALLDGRKTAFVIHNVINVMQTNDVGFCDTMYAHVQNLIRKSTLISTVSEKERAKFFKSLRNRITGRKQNLKV